MMHRFARWVLAFVATVCLAAVAAAQEEIRSFDVDILVETDGDIIVTETIRVNVEGRNIRRGIFRELPAYYGDEDRPGKLPYRYDILSITKDGAREPYARDTIGNALQIRIGDPDVYLDYRGSALLTSRGVASSEPITRVPWCQDVVLRCTPWSLLSLDGSLAATVGL